MLNAREVQLKDLDSALSVSLLDLSDDTEAQALRMEHFKAAIRAWADLYEVRL